MADKPKQYPYLIKDKKGKTRWGSAPRKKAAEVIMIKAQKPGVLPAHKILADVTGPHTGDVASIASVGGWVDEEGVINFGTKAPPSLTQEQREAWLESQEPEQVDIRPTGLEVGEISPEQQRAYRAFMADTMPSKFMEGLERMRSDGWKRDAEAQEHTVSEDFYDAITTPIGDPIIDIGTDMEPLKKAVEDFHAQKKKSKWEKK